MSNERRSYKLTYSAKEDKKIKRKGTRKLNNEINSTI